MRSVGKIPEVAKWIETDWQDVLREECECAKVYED